MTTSEEFHGFPAEAFGFLRGLAEHNDAAWFEAHKATYQRALEEPGKRLVEALGPRLLPLDPRLSWSPKVFGSLFTIRRDVRFSKDKRPFKEELGLRFWHGAERKACQSSFHMRLTKDFVGFGAGVWTFEPEALLRYRRAVDDERQGAALVAALAGLERTRCQWQQEAWKRVPAPYPADHPRGELLRQRGLAVGFDVPHPACVADAEFAAFCAEQFEVLAPVHRWLVEALGEA